MNSGKQAERHHNERYETTHEPAGSDMGRPEIKPFALRRRSFAASLRRKRRRR
jgi:hypothetical protein